MGSDEQHQLSAYARSLGLCGEPFGYGLACDEPAGHEPIAPPHWMHSETVSGPIDEKRRELWEARDARELWL